MPTEAQEAEEAQEDLVAVDLALLIGMKAPAAEAEEAEAEEAMST